MDDNSTDLSTTNSSGDADAAWIDTAKAALRGEPVINDTGAPILFILDNFNDYTVTHLPVGACDVALITVFDVPEVAYRLLCRCASVPFDRYSSLIAYRIGDESFAVAYPSGVALDFTVSYPVVDQPAEDGDDPGSLW